jgi:mannose-6-phosphate isomerase-like protein (cupin superfamily)
MPQSQPRPAAAATVQVDNERVRVTEYRFSPGAETGWHRHGWDYVVVPQTDGDLLIVGPGGEESRAALGRGVSYYRAAGVEHNVINAGATVLVFIEIEMKAHPVADD